MTQLEYFKEWAAERYPNMDQTTDEKALKDGTVLFLHDVLQVAWRAFQYRYTIRPTTTMANHTFNKAEFRKDKPETIVDRLNGRYFQVDPPYKTSLLEQEAAREIERLRGGEPVGFIWRKKGDSYPYAWKFMPDLTEIKNMDTDTKYEVKLVYADNKKPAEAG